jgi:membrane-associated phospholipid phosphatase
MLASCLLLAGCTTLPDGSRWGANATITPGWQRVGEAALDAARNPWVWGPLAGAAILQIDSWDEDVSDWAHDSTPVFGSESNAADWSTGLQVASVAVYVSSVLATPSGEVDGDWFAAKAKGTAVGLGAFAVTSGVTSGLKSVVSRERPDGSDDDSFPSGHASTAAVFDTLTVRNLKTIDMSPALRTTLVVGTGAITAGSAWARVEANKHYPSDVLVGVAIGNYMAAFFTDAFMGLAPDSRLGFSAEPAPGGAMLRVDVRF